MLRRKLETLIALLQSPDVNDGWIAHELDEDAGSPEYIFVRVLAPHFPNPLESTAMPRELGERLFPEPDSTGQPAFTSAAISSPSRKKYRLATASFSSAGPDAKGSGRIQVARDASVDGELLSHFIRGLAGVLAIALIAGAALGRHLTATALNPLRMFTASVATIDKLTNKQRLGLTGLPGELKELGRAFNGMLGRLETSHDRLQHFSENIAHELRTPINNMQLGVDVALMQARSIEDYRNVLESVSEDGARLSRLVNDLLLLARCENTDMIIERQAVDIAAEIAAIRDYIEAAATERSIRLETACRQGLPANVNRSLFQRAIGNLCDNALRHTKSGGTVAIRVFEFPGRIRIEVADTGEGIAADRLPHVFDRFYTAAWHRPESADRTGLGLSIVKSVVELHGGTIAISSTPRVGTTVTLELPSAGGGKATP